LATLRAYNLPVEAEDLLVNMALWKIRRLLSGGLRLRTACDLEAKELVVTRPLGFTLPAEEELAAAVKEGIEKCAGMFADPLVTDVVWEPKPKENKKKKDGHDDTGLMTDVVDEPKPES
jgi:CRISPR-associated protein Csb1